jgi:hypothetical protein
MYWTRTLLVGFACCLPLPAWAQAHALPRDNRPFNARITAETGIVVSELKAVEAPKEK